MVQHARYEARLHLRQHEPVAVVVVADVRVVQPRQRPPFVRRPLVLAVPGDDGVEAVGVHRGHDQHHDRIEQAGQGRIGRQLVGERQAHQTRGDFRRVDVVVDQHHGGLHDPQLSERRGGEPAGVREQALAALQLLEPPLIGGRGDRE